MGFDGFDGVELVMELEDRLGITIPDRDAERLRTPGETVDYLAERLRVPPAPLDVHCRSAAAFRHGRRRIAVSFDVPLTKLRPSTSTSVLLTAGTNVAARRARWSRLSVTLGVPLPDMKHPTWAAATAIAVGLISLVWWAWCAQPPATTRGTVALVAVAVGLALLLPALLLIGSRRWLASDLPRGYQTLGDVTSVLTKQTIPTAPAEVDGWTRHELCELVRDLTAESAGCSPSQVKRHRRWPA